MDPLKILTAIFFCLLIGQSGFSQKINRKDADSEEKLFSFGIVADIQYADAVTAKGRNYRRSLHKLEKCVSEFNRHDLAFIVTLGDLIDHDKKSYDKPLSMIEKLKVPVYNVIGNHDFSVDDKFKPKIKQWLENRKGYFDFDFGSFRFIVLDGTGLSTFAYKKDTPKYKEGLAKCQELKKEGFNNAFTFNGGIGGKQLKWLEKQLLIADRKNRTVIIFCHWPLLPEDHLQLWDNREVLKLLSKHKCVAAWIAGHRHEGSYEKKEGIHHLTLKSIVESKSETSFGIIEVYRDKLLLKGYGDQNNRILNY